MLKFYGCLELSLFQITLKFLVAPITNVDGIPGINATGPLLTITDYMAGRNLWTFIAYNIIEGKTYHAAKELYFEAGKLNFHIIYNAWLNFDIMSCEVILGIKRQNYSYS